MKKIALAVGFSLLSLSAFAEPIGTLNQANGGFGPDLWAKSNGATVSKLLKIVPESVLSPVTHQLVRAALLTKATPPVGLSDSDFLKARITAFIKLGDGADAGALLHSANSSFVDEATARAVIEAQFNAGETEAACLDVRSLQQRFATPYWKKANFVCEIDAGQKDQATNDFAALPSDESNFTSLGQAALNGTSLTNLSSLSTGLEFALLRQTRSTLPPSLLQSDDVLIMTGIARTDSVPAATRVEAGYFAAVQGSLYGDELLALYRLPGAGLPAGQGATIGRDDPTQAMAAAAHRDAAAVQQAETSKEGNQRVALLRQALTENSDNADIPFNARTNLLRILPISGDRDALAPAAARALYIEGDIIAAARWRDMVKTGKNADILWPYSAIAADDPQAVASDAALRKWTNSRLNSKDPSAPRQIERVLAVLTAFGVTVPDDVWVSAIDKPDDETAIMGSMAVGAEMAKASNEDARGETLLLVAISLKDGPGHAHPLNLNHAIAAIRHVGLENPAKAIALEGIAPITLPQ